MSARCKAIYGLHKLDMRNKANANIVRNAEMEKIMMQENMRVEQTVETEQGMRALPPDEKQIRAHFSKLGSMMFCGTLIIIIGQVICRGIASAGEAVLHSAA